MIVVSIALAPFGRMDRITEIGRMYIANTGDGTAQRGDYNVKVCRRGSFEWKGRDAVKSTRTGSVKSYPRLSYNVWRLIARSILSAFPEERTHPSDCECDTCSDPEIRS